MATSEDQASADKHSSSQIRLKIEKCKQKATQVRERIASEQQQLKKCVDDYVLASSESDAKDPQFPHIKAQFEKKSARAQANLKQHQTKLQLILEKQAGFERAYRDQLRKAEHGVHFDTFTSQSITGPIVSAKVDSSTRSNDGSAQTQSAGAPSVPTQRSGSREQVNSGATDALSGLKKPVASTNSLNVLVPNVGQPMVRRGSLKPNASASALKAPLAVSASLKYSPADAEFNQSFLTSSLPERQQNMLRGANLAPPLLNRQQSNSTDALSIKADKEGATRSLDRRLPILESASKRIASVDNLHDAQSNPITPGSGPVAKHGSTSLLDDVELSSSRNELQIATDPTRLSTSSVTDDERKVGSSGALANNRHAQCFDADLVTMQTQLHRLQESLQIVRDTQVRQHEEFRYRMERLTEQTNNLANRCTHLEEHLNDQVDLHQSSTRSLNNEIAVIYDKLMFANRERKHEIEQFGENLSNRLGSLEAEQRRKQQIDPFNQNELTSSVLVAKLIKLAIALVSVVMLAISMLTAVANSAFRSPLRLVITVLLCTLLLAWFLRDELLDDSVASSSQSTARSNSLNLLNRLGNMIAYQGRRLFDRIAQSASSVSQQANSD